MNNKVTTPQYSDDYEIVRAKALANFVFRSIMEQAHVAIPADEMRRLNQEAVNRAALANEMLIDGDAYDSSAFILYATNGGDCEDWDAPENTEEIQKIRNRIRKGSAQGQSVVKENILDTLRQALALTRNAFTHQNIDGEFYYCLTSYSKNETDDYKIDGEYIVEDMKDFVYQLDEELMEMFADRFMDDVKRHLLPKLKGDDGYCWNYSEEISFTTAVAYYCCFAQSLAPELYDKHSLLFNIGVAVANENTISLITLEDIYNAQNKDCIAGFKEFCD